MTGLAGARRSCARRTGRATFRIGRANPEQGEGSGTAASSPEGKPSYHGPAPPAGSKQGATPVAIRDPLPDLFIGAIPATALAHGLKFQRFEGEARVRRSLTETGARPS